MHVSGGGDCCGGGSGAVLAGGRHSGALVGSGMGSGFGPGYGTGTGTGTTSKQTLDVALDQGHQIQAVAWVGLRVPAAVWGMHASKVLGPWYPPQIGPMLVKAEENTTKRGTITWVREPAVS